MSLPGTSSVEGGSHFPLVSVLSAWTNALPLCPSFPPSRLPNTKCFSRYSSPSSGPPGLKSPAGIHMKALPVQNPRGTQGCHTHRLGPWAPHAGPWKLGSNTPGNRQRATQREEPPGGTWSMVHLGLAEDAEHVDTVLGQHLACWCRWRNTGALLLPRAWQKEESQEVRVAQGYQRGGV